MMHVRMGTENSTFAYFSCHNREPHRHTLTWCPLPSPSGAVRQPVLPHWHLGLPRPPELLRAAPLLHDLHRQLCGQGPGQGQHKAPCATTAGATAQGDLLPICHQCSPGSASCCFHCIHGPGQRSGGAAAAVAAGLISWDELWAAAWIVDQQLLQPLLQLRSVVY